MKKRWWIEAVTWKASSTIIGVLVVWFISGQWKLSALYLGIYVPISAVWYIIHKQLWSWWKHKRYGEKTQK